MGLLTTVTFTNDFVERIDEDPEFSYKLSRAIACGEPKLITQERLASLVKMHTQRDTHDSTTYVQLGGEVCEMEINSEETEKLARDYPDYFKEMLDYMEKQTIELRKMLQERE